MKITIVQGAFLPVPPVLGGAVEKIHYALGREFARRNCEVTHISRLHADLAACERVEGVTYRRVPGYDTPHSLLKLKLLDLLYSLRVLRTLPPADILVTNTFFLPILVRTQRYGRVYVNVNRYPKRQMRLYRHVTRIQAVSNAVAEAICEQTPDCTHLVKIIPNSLSENWMEPPVDLTAPRENWILYVGRVHPEKGIGLLIDAYSQAVQSGLTGWRLVIVGPWETRYGGGGDEYYQRLLVQSQGVADKIDWIGSIFEDNRLKGYYDSASLFVYPSLAERGESFGLAPLEAMGRGCIPIVSSLTCFRDYMQSGINGFQFDHRGTVPATALAKILIEATKRDTLLGPVRQAAVETARKFTVGSVAEQMVEDFKSLI